MINKIQIRWGEMMFADLVFLNGEVITVNEKNAITEAVAVKGNQILAVGTNLEMESFVGIKTEVIDLDGKSLLPGFIDSHLHMTQIGTYKLGISCKEPNIKTVDDVLKEISKAVKETPEGQWVRAWGFDESKIADRRFPLISELDQISTKHPIILRRACGHICMVNSLGLEMANITENTPNPEGGIIEKNENGDLTGILIENAQMPLYTLADYSMEDIKKGLVLAAKDFAAAGITSVHDAGVSTPDTFRLMQETIRKGDINVRVYAVACVINKSEEYVKKIVDSGITTGLGNERYRIGPAKVFIDGSSSGPTAAMKQPYNHNQDDYGLLYYTQEELNQILGEAHEKGFQITAHAQGDRAIEMMLNCIEEALRKHPRKNHRHRIEHAGITTPDLVQRMKKLEVIPVPNPNFFLEYGDRYIDCYGDRVNHQYPVRDFIDNGIIVAGGSDSPVSSFNPLLGIHAAVNRMSPLGQSVGANQRISILEAIKLYSWNGAYASFEEDIKGSIETGKLADLVVLNGSIINTPIDQIKNIQVDQTIFDGKKVYQRENMKVKV